MKHIKNFFRILFVLFCISQTSSAQVVENISEEYFDSVEVSLLTCSPHEEIYSLYGHSALRWHDMHQEGAHAGEDIAFNWGIFNFKAPYFVLRFVFGLTDYELGPIPYNSFCTYYDYWNSSVTEQVLNLTNVEKRNLRKALVNNLQSENRIYRYNFFYDNCSTRPRNIIEKCLNRKIEYVQREDYTPTYRDMVRFATRNHPWAKFGNDMLLGVRADIKTDLRQQEFLPENLLYDFDHAKLYADGTYMPLVKERRVVVPPGVQIIEEDFPMTPTECAFIFLIISLLISFIEWKHKKSFVLWDVILMLTQGSVGLVLFVMIFSQHPTTSINFQLLLFNPLPFFFLPAVIRRKESKWQKLLFSMIILFVIGSFIQSYAEGMIIVALCLLIRVITHYYLKKGKI